MVLMYCEAFNLREKPFSLAADPRYLYMSKQHWEAMAHLMYGIEDAWGFVLLTGEIGTGKTTLCRLFLEQMPSDVEVAFLLNPKLTVQELFASICDEFCIPHSPASSGTREHFDLISAYLLEIYARAHKALLVIDEAQCLSPDVLDQLRLLTNLEAEGGKLLRIILLGQPELRDKLAQPYLQQMSQRITARYHLNPLPRHEVTAYVRHRIMLAGGKEQLFTSSAIRALCRMSRGVPRLINLLCDRSLLGACMKNEKVVTRATMIQAGREALQGERFVNRLHGSAGFRWAAGGAAAGLLVVLILFLSFADPARNITAATLLRQLAVAGPAATAPASAKVWWPAGLELERSRASAYKGLLKHVGLTYASSTPLTGKAFCADMELFNLQCREHQAAVRDLKTLPVPLVMELTADDGSVLFAALLLVRGEKALLRIGDAETEVAVSDVQARWTGRYTTLEKSGGPQALQPSVSVSDIGSRQD